MESGPAEAIHRVGGEKDPLGHDLWDGIQAWPIWTMLGWQDIRQRYRRSAIGPFWITLSMATLILLLGVIYSRIFKMDIATYLPFLALGLILWGFISGSMTESCASFQESERIIKQVKWPFSIYVLRIVWRNIIVFLHTVVIYIPIAIVFSVKPHLSSLLVLPGLVLVFVNQVWLGLVLAILSARFRDVVPIVSTVVNILMFATPILWPVSTLGDLTIVADVNPVYHFIELVRAPLLGQPPHLLSWIVAIGTIVVGFIVAVLLFRRVEHRIVYWL